jgi:S1-C subfamily serine protease
MSKNVVQRHSLRARHQILWLLPSALALYSCTVQPSSNAPAHPTPGQASIPVSETPAPAVPQGAFDATKVAQQLVPAVGLIILRTTSGLQEGSGFIVANESSVSYMATNNHVVAGASRVIVLMPDGKHFDADVQGTDPIQDVAVLRLNDPNLPKAQFGDSTKLLVGQPVIAIGSPLGQENQGSVTAGIVSGLHRFITAGGNPAAGNSETLPDVIQTDAAINPGNSGGPLVDAAGQVVGMNTAASSGANGIGYAIPSLIVKRIAEALIAGQKPGHPFLGIGFEDAATALSRGDPINGYGVLVTDVTPGSAADKAGVKRSDVIEKVDGVDLTNGQTLGGQIQIHNPGDVVTLTILRGGQTMDVKVTLGDRPAGA